MSIDMGAGASGSVSAGGSVGGSIDGGIGASLAGGLGSTVSAGLAVAGGLALSAAANMAASVSLSGGLSASFSAGFGAPSAVGANPPDIVPVFKFIVDIEGLGPIRFRVCGPIGVDPATASAAPPAPLASTATHTGTPPAHGTNTHPAAHETPRQAGQNGTGAMLPPTGAWTWKPLTLQWGMAKDSTALLNWIILATKGIYKPLRGVTVTLLDLEGKMVMAWNFKKTFPKAWSIPAFDASKSELVIQSLTLAHQGAEVQLA